MLIQTEETIQEIGIDWGNTVSIIEDAVHCLSQGDYSQPVKPYLRYGNPKNRIIAMPAFVGGSIHMAGIKWIASFPGNIEKGVPRAHSVVLLNNADTGQPLCMIDTPLLSVVRTASVSGLMLKYFHQVRKPVSLQVGMTGFGPIGQYHLKMCLSLFGDIIEKVKVYDLRGVDSSLVSDPRVEIVDSWESAYSGADVFMTCTVSDAPYIDKEPKAGSLHLNVSLRDYKTSVYPWFQGCIVVDDWEEICREKTDIEMMHLEKGLEKGQTHSIVDVVEHGCLEGYDAEAPIMFNPMGMAVFDIAIGSYYYQTASHNSLEPA